MESFLPSQIRDVHRNAFGGRREATSRAITRIRAVWSSTRRSTCADELRTPLTSIQGYTETLLDSASENNHSREFLEIIRKNAARMSRLTEDLLTLARVESGEQRFDMQAVSSEEILQEAVQSFREVARTHGIELEVSNRAQGLVVADREAVSHVFSNLIDNALKYGTSGKLVVLNAGTGSSRCAARIASAVAPRYGGAPVASSHRMHPSA